MNLKLANNPIEFNYEGHQVRTLLINQEPWWVAKDVCDVLDLANPTEATRGLDEDEKLVSEILSAGQKRSVILINEPGLYTLILRSNKPEAKPFKRWVTHEVLPSIRKTGQYSFTQQRVLELYVRELGPYAPMFPKDYYYEIHRLMGWDYDPDRTERPGYMGKLTNKLIYECLPPRVLGRLQEVNPADSGRRKSKHHQFLTDEVGRKHLQKQIDFVVEMAKICSSMDMLLELCANKSKQIYGNESEQLKFLQVKYELVNI